MKRKYLENAVNVIWPFVNLGAYLFEKGISLSSIYPLLLFLLISAIMSVNFVRDGNYGKLISALNAFNSLSIYLHSRFGGGPTIGDIAMNAPLTYYSSILAARFVYKKDA